jgi:hypothetical protein
VILNTSITLNRKYCIILCLSDCLCIINSVVKMALLNLLPFCATINKTTRRLVNWYRSMGLVRDKTIKNCKSPDGRPRLVGWLLSLAFPRSLQQVLDGSPIEVTLAKPVDKDSYVRYTRGTGGRNTMLQGEYTYPLSHVYDPTTTYLGAPVFYTPQAYAAIPSLHFPATKGHLSNRALIRTPSVRGNTS